MDFSTFFQKKNDPDVRSLTTYRQRSQRGVTLVEAVLYLVVAASSIVLVANIIFNEQERQTDVVEASQVKIIIEQAQAFVVADYDTIRQELYEEAIAQVDNSVALTYTMQDLVDRGFLPSSFLESGTITNEFGQEYFLLARGVNRQDAATPKATLELGVSIPSEADWATFVTNHESPWIEEDPTPGLDRFDIEAIIIASGGDPIPPQRGNRISGATGLSTAGYVQEISPPTMSGAFGTYQYDISGFDVLPEYPTIPNPADRGFVGNIGGIVALSGLNDVFFTGGGEGGGEIENNFVYRCADPSNADHPTQDFTYNYTDCLAATEVYQNIVFADPAVVTNVQGAIRNVQEIAMSNGDISGVTALTMDTGGTIEMAGGSITNPSAITMQAGGTIAGDNVSIDLGTGGNSGTITNVASLGFDCGTVSGAGTSLDIPCNTLISGGSTLTVSGDTTLQTTLSVGTDATIGNDLSVGNDGNITRNLAVGTDISAGNNISATNNIAALGRVTGGDMTGFSADTLTNADVIAQNQLAVGDPPQDGASFTADVPGVLIEGNGADGGVVFANDFIIRDINSSDGGLSLAGSLVVAADITPNSASPDNQVPIPECGGVPGDPQSYPSVSAVSTVDVITDTEITAATPTTRLAATPVNNWDRYQDQPLLGYRYEQFGVTSAGIDVASTDPTAEFWRFNLIGRFANLADPTDDPDPVVNPVIELYLDTPGDNNRMFVITRCAPSI